MNLLVENKDLYKVYPYRRNRMRRDELVRLQARPDAGAQKLYIDAQKNSSQGKGWYRIVTDPIQARRVINEGKLHVVMGIEVSRPFGCQVYNDAAPVRPDADRPPRSWMRPTGYGVRQMEIVDEFDNALAGVAATAGSTSAVVNNGKPGFHTGEYWQIRLLQPPRQDRPAADRSVQQRSQRPGQQCDREPAADRGGPGLSQRLRAATPTDWPSACGRLHLIQPLSVSKQMIVDPDHLSVHARKW